MRYHGLASAALWIMVVQLTQHSPMIEWQVADCSQARWDFYLLAMQDWAARSHIPFTGAIGCHWSAVLPPELADTKQPNLGVLVTR